MIRMKFPVINNIVWENEDKTNKLSSAVDQPKGSVEARVDEGFGWSAYALRKPCLKFGLNLLSLKASRIISKIDDIAGFPAGDDDDHGHSWVGLMTVCIV